MTKVSVFRTWAILVSVLVHSTASAEETVFVDRGRPILVRAQEGPWSNEGDVLVGKGKGAVLYLKKTLGPGDFQYVARLTIRQVDKSAASLVINGSHFGFEGQADEMFTEGPLFGRRNLGVPIVNEGTPFELIASRRGERLIISIDGREVVSAPLPATEEVSIGLRPWRSTMEVARLTASGNLIDPPQPLPHTVVYQRGEGGYHTYRIPAIVATKSGVLLAFCEGRKSGSGDAGNIDMLVSRSTDAGKTWSKPQVVWDDGKNTCGNPAPVVDQATGTIWLPMTWNLGSDHEQQIMNGASQDARHVYITHSNDDGLTWASPKRISETTRKPHWRWYATGPGNAIQLTRGLRAGRLLIPANHSDHSDSQKHPYRSHVIWSDDHGATWRLGGVHEDRTNESAVVELSDGSILQAMRSYHGKNRRAMAASQDGGATWSKVHLQDALVTPVCQASILRYSWPGSGSPDGRSRILFSSPYGSSRSNLHVWISYDEGKTWPVRKQVFPGGSAYSNLVRLPEGRIGLLYEKDGYQTISFVSLDLAWLESKRR